MEIRIKASFNFSKQQIAAIAVTHPELGRYLAAEAFFKTNAIAARQPATIRKPHVITPDDTLFMLNTKARMPGKGTKLWDAANQLTSCFHHRTFTYAELKHFCAARPHWSTAMPAHLRNKRLVVKA